MFSQNGTKIEPLRTENGSQNGIESEKRVFNSNQGIVYENHDFGPSRAPALKTTKSILQPKTEFDLEIEFLSIFGPFSFHFGSILNVQTYPWTLIFRPQVWGVEKGAPKDLQES